MIFISKRGAKILFRKGCLTMPVSAAQHRATIGTHQNQLLRTTEGATLLILLL
jgi:hypothetical protein